MSRIGKKPVTIPAGVEVHVGNGVVRVKGPKGTMIVDLMPEISAEVDGTELKVTRANDERQTRAYHGLNRSLIANAVTGVSDGWSKQLDIVGIGYRAESKGSEVVFSLGYSNPVVYQVPEGITIEVDAKANRVTVTGIDRQRVGQVAAEIRGLRPPEPYKGKGVRYADERIRMKAGKQGATA
jgi:large subunit ribosomal protein L6